MNVATDGLAMQQSRQVATAIAAAVAGAVLFFVTTTAVIISISITQAGVIVRAAGADVTIILMVHFL